MCHTPRWRLTYLCRQPRAFLARGCTYAFEAARQDKTAVVTVVSETKLTIEFDKLRRRPRRDSHGSSRLSVVYSHLLGQDDTAC